MSEGVDAAGAPARHGVIMQGRIAFVVSDEDAFVASGLPLVRAAREVELEADVITPAASRRAAVEATGACPIGLGADLGSLNPMRAGYSAGQLAAVLKRTKPDLVHCVGLGPALIGGAAGAMAGIDRRIYAIGPLGKLTGGTGLVARAARWATAILLKGPLQSRGTRYVFETAQDARLLGFGPERAYVHVAGTGIERDVMDDTQRLYRVMLAGAGGA